jgi:hypothetical protein
VNSFPSNPWVIYLSRFGTANTDGAFLFVSIAHASTSASRLIESMLTNIAIARSKLQRLITVITPFYTRYVAQYTSFITSLQQQWGL